MYVLSGEGWRAKGCVSSPRADPQLRYKSFAQRVFTGEHSSIRQSCRPVVFNQYALLLDSVLVNMCFSMRKWARISGCLKLDTCYV